MRDNDLDVMTQYSLRPIVELIKDKRWHDRDMRHQRKLWAIKYKGGYCNECGGEFHHAAMHFHHVLENKQFTISQILTRNQQRLIAELDKCELLCANCHAIRHWYLNRID